MAKDVTVLTFKCWRRIFSVIALLTHFAFLQNGQKNAVAPSSNAIDTFGNFLVSEKSNKSARPIPATGREMSYIERVSFIEIYWSLVSLAHFMNFTVIRINTL